MFHFYLYTAGREWDQKEGVENLQKKYNKRVKFIECDLSSLKSVKKAASSFKALGLPLHVLINNGKLFFFNFSRVQVLYLLNLFLNEMAKVDFSISFNFI